MAPSEARLVVAIRPRPLSANEPADSGLVFDPPGAPAHSIRLVQGTSTTNLAFDRIFGNSEANNAVYDAVAKPIVLASLRGVSGAVAACALGTCCADDIELTVRFPRADTSPLRRADGLRQDASYAWHAQGPGCRAAVGPSFHLRAFRFVSSPHSPYPAVGHLLTHRRAPGPRVQGASASGLRARLTRSQVSLSYVEIYNEQLKDLLNPDAKLDVLEDGHGGVELRGCVPADLASVEAAMRLLAKGDSRRATAETAMNAASSRSHAIVRVQISSSPAGMSLEGRGLVATLSLVDLAGSESAKKARKS